MQAAPIAQTKDSPHIDAGSHFLRESIGHMASCDFKSKGHLVDAAIRLRSASTALQITIQHHTSYLYPLLIGTSARPYYYSLHISTLSTSLLYVLLW